MVAKSIRSAVIVINPQKPETERDAAELHSYLESRGVTVNWGTLANETFRNRLAAQPPDACIALGGDGTMLRAAHICAPLGVPILGINLGRFGFLAELTRENWPESMPRLLNGDYWLEQRMMLEAIQLRGSQPLHCWDILNEIVITRGMLVRPIQLEARVDGHQLSNYVADGLIVATPTGSTAYSLAVGGPILPPESCNLLVIAVAPHLSMDRAIVLPEDAQVEVTVHTEHEAVLSIDGQPSIPVEDSDLVRVKASDRSVSFIRFQPIGYFYRNITRYMENNPRTEDLA